MTVSLTLKALFDNILQTKFLKNVYHAVTLQPRLEGGGSSPAASVSGRFVYVGPDDTKGFTGYIRQTGAAEVRDKVAIGSQKWMYNMKFPFRAVFFNQNEKRSFEDLTATLTKAIIKTPRVELIRINPIREDLLKQEVPSGTFKFKTSTYYASIDFFVFLSLQADNCEQVLSCSDLANPYCSPV
jgi:hypothetical protein